MSKFLQIGRIVNTHGVRGEIRVVPLTDDPQRFKTLQWVYVDTQKEGKPSSAEVNESLLVKYDITDIKYHKNFVILKFKNVDDIDTAEKLKQSYLVIRRESAVKLPPGSFFICDILGLKVFDREDNLIGTIKDVLQTGSNDVYVVVREGKRDLLVPALKDVVKEVSVENKKMVISIPEGLDDDEV